MKWLPSAAAALAVAAGVARADGCSLSAYSTLQSDGTHAGAAPGAIGPPTVTIKRGQAPKSSGCGQMSGSSCDDLGSLGLHFAPAPDPDSDAAHVGYRIRVVRGTVPPGLVIDDGALVPGPSGNEASLYLSWLDGATDDQESIDFSLTLTPVDEHGNEGPTSAPIHVHDDGGSGCTVHAPGRRTHGATWLALLVLGLPFLRRALGARRGPSSRKAGMRR